MDIKLFLVATAMLGGVVFAMDKVGVRKETATKTTEKKVPTREKKRYVQIIYEDYAALDTVTLLKRYNLVPVYGVADGVLIFLYTGEEELIDLIRQIKKEQKGIADIRIYRKYHFKTF